MSECSKIPYCSCNQATVAMRGIRRKYIAGGVKPPTGAYFCGTCKQWHLTSKSATRTPPWQKTRTER
jgi:hypothetical protein